MQLIKQLDSAHIKYSLQVFLNRGLSDVEPSHHTSS